MCAGLTANSGHYYAYCRRTDLTAADIALAESPGALADVGSCPWYKLNDSRVMKIDWATVTGDVEKSMTDTTYLLLYR